MGSSLRCSDSVDDRCGAAAYNRRQRDYQVAAAITCAASVLMQLHTMSGQTAPAAVTQLLRRPRAWIVGVFALALLIALLAPLAQLWRASVTPLDARACVWPRVPLVGQPAQIVVALPTGVEQSASQATRAIAEWDMANMQIGRAHV